MQLFTNRLPYRQLVSQQGLDLTSQGVQCLLVHFIVVLTKINADETLLKPLKELMTSPQHLTVSPTYFANTCAKFKPSTLLS